MSIAEGRRCLSQMLRVKSTGGRDAMGQRGRSGYAVSLLPLRDLLEDRQLTDPNEPASEIDGASADEIHQAP